MERRKESGDADLKRLKASSPGPDSSITNRVEDLNKSVQVFRTPPPAPRGSTVVHFVYIQSLSLSCQTCIKLIFGAFSQLANKYKEDAEAQAAILAKALKIATTEVYRPHACACQMCERE